MIALGIPANRNLVPYAGVVGRGVALGVAVALSGAQASAQEEVRAGDVVEGTITATSDVIRTPSLAQVYSDEPIRGHTYRLQLEEPGPLTIELRSWSFDAYLVLRQVGGEVVAEDDDGLVNTQARISLADVGRGATYLVQACALPGRSGVFELVVRRELPASLSPEERAAAAVEDAMHTVAALEQHEGDGLPLATELTRLGVLELERGNAVEARSAFERALAIQRSLFGSEHLEVARSLNNLGATFWSLGDYEAAREHFEGALAIHEELLGPEDPTTLENLNNVGFMLAELGELERARVAYERALELRERQFGPDHLEVATSLSNLGSLLFELGEYAQAQRYHERALAIHEAEVGPEHPDTAMSLEHLGLVLSEQGRYAEARPLYERALAIRQSSQGPEHPAVAGSLAILAAAARLEGDLVQALAYGRRALAIREATLGPDHPETAMAVHDVGFMLWEQGRHSPAQAFFERALEINERALGPLHPRTATSLQHLADLLRDQGELTAARPRLERALAIQEENLGPEHPTVAQSLNSLALLVMELNEVDTAQRLFERTLRIVEAARGQDHPEVATTLANLASVLDQKGEFEAAHAHLVRSVAIQERAFGAEHPETAHSLSLLAQHLQLRGELAAARPLQERALAILEGAHGPSHPAVVSSRYGLGVLAWREGALEEARSHLARALEQDQRHLGIAHPTTLSGAGALALVHLDRGEPEHARALLLESDATGWAHFQRMLGGLTEAESFRYLAGLRTHFLILTSVPPLDDPRTYERVLSWKGQVSRLLVASRERLTGDLDPRQARLLQGLREKQAKLSRALLEPQAPEREALLERLVDERQRLELELARTLDDSERVKEATLPQLRAALPPASAVLDLLVQPIYVPAQWVDGQVVEAGGLGEDRVIAWVVHPEREDGRDPVRLDLGPAAALERAVQAFLAGLVAPSAAPARGVPLDATDAPRRVSRASAELRELLWDPLSPHLEGVERVFVSPDGFLGTLPFETLQLENGSFLVEELAFVYSQDLKALVTGARGEARARYESLCVVGDVDFDARSGPREAPGGGGEPETLGAMSLRGPGSLSSDWPRLPGSATEARVVRDLHVAAFGDAGERLLLRGAEAKEERLKRELGGHAILHLATHGYLRPEGAASMWESALEASGDRRAPTSEGAGPLVGKHPGLLSGLVCAGANRRSGVGEDGYLTAEEVGWLDLTETELVVMSACETGLGRPESGEGLLGLRRAFRIAGAKTVISSLWSVEDDATAELMVGFYENLFLRGMGRHEALRSAQLAMLQRNRIEHGDALPSTWGAFVLSGEWR